MMIQLILHGIGDYFLQTDKQALGKKNKGLYGFKCCFIHCLTYSLPFLFIGSWKAVLAIFVTHFIIDRTNIVAYVLAWKNGVKDWKPVVISEKPLGRNMVERKLSDDKKWFYDISNFGFGKERPFAITIWLYIICDNLCHIICNYLALKYL